MSCPSLRPIKTEAPSPKSAALPTVHHHRSKSRRSSLAKVARQGLKKSGREKQKGGTDDAALLILFRRCLLVHRLEEIVVGLGMLKLVEQELHRIGDAHRHQATAQHPHLAERRLVNQQLFLTRARLGDVDRREGALVAELAVKDEF